MPGSDAVFLDTSGWVALLNADDQLHPLASIRLREFADAKRRLVTTDCVLAETGNGLARLSIRNRLMRAVEAFAQSPQSRLLRIDIEMFHQALRLYDQVADKTWGLVDCASFITMRAEGIQDVLTADHHFHQAGFRCLLVP